jgi:hypothetical protein
LEWVPAALRLEPIPFFYAGRLRLDGLLTASREAKTSLEEQTRHPITASAATWRINSDQSRTDQLFCTPCLLRKTTGWTWKSWITGSYQTISPAKNEDAPFPSEREDVACKVSTASLHVA